MLEIIISPRFILGTVVSQLQQEQNVTIIGPTVPMISVAAVVYDMIAVNIPDAGVVASIEARIEEEGQIKPNSAAIIFTARINTHRQPLMIMIPQESIIAMEKGSNYSIKVSDHVLSTLNAHTNNKPYTHNYYDRLSLFSTTNPKVHTDFLSYLSLVVS